MENIFNKLDLRIFLSLGSNLDDRERNLRDAVERIKTLGIEVVKASSIYETEPVGFVEQHWFLNQVLEVKFGKEIHLPIHAELQKHIEKNKESQLSLMLLSEELLRALLEIENDLGRQRTFENAPRVIDVDLLLFNDLIYIKDISSVTQASGKERFDTGIIIPHPRLHLRRFVLVPLCEIAPDFIHPVRKISVAEILAGLSDHSVVRVYRNP